MTIAMVNPKRQTFSQLSPIFILLRITAHAIAQPPFRFHSCVYDKGYYTANSTHHTNLNALLSSLSSSESDNISGYGAFVSSSHGENPGKAYAIALCRGDVGADVCRSCIANSTALLPQLCPNQNEAIGWYDLCTLRYSFRDMRGIMETEPAFYAWNRQNVSSDIDAFHGEVRSLLEELRSRAADGGSLRKFAAGSRTSANSYETIYGVSQCTPDLSAVDCSDCLVSAVGGLTRYCKGSSGARFGMPSCTVIYGLQLFYDASADQSPTLSPPPPPIISPPPPLFSPPPSTNGTAENGTSFELLLE